MKPKKTLSVYVLLVGVMGLLIVGGIVVFQIFKEATKSQLTQSQNAAVKPLDGKIEVEVVQDLSTRTVLTKENLRQLPTVAPTPEPTRSIPTATESGSIATSSAIMER